MRNIVIAAVAILGLSLLLTIPALADVTNIGLSKVGANGVTGSATALTGSIDGSSPHTNVELNIKMSKAPPANMVYQVWMTDSKTNANSSIGSSTGTMFTARSSWAGSFANNPFNTILVSVEPANTVSVSPTTVVARGSWASGTAVTAANFPAAAVLPQDESFQRQSVMQRYHLTADQVNSLRMQGWSYNDITMMANAAAKCGNKTVADISNQLTQGQTWDQVAASCNTTVAELMNPTSTPGTVGAGAGMPMVAPFTYYRMYPNGAPVLTQSQWRGYQLRGYSWVDVAIAANIVSISGSGMTMDDLLRAIRIQGRTWNDIITEQGLDPNQVYNIAAWPWERVGGSMTSSLEHEMQQQGVNPNAVTPSTPGTTGAGTETPPSPPPSSPSY